ncbi:MAG: serine/threonine protein kinase [Gemmatimonadota bacterium]|nr:MAG: serine/threonine protein kinase [Gemmatimonadota bacterium]
MDTGDLKPGESANDTSRGDQSGYPDVEQNHSPIPNRGSDELEALLKSELAPELEIVRRLGRGAMAYVYLARERQLKRLVAVKVLSPKLARDERARLRFEREAQAVAALSHPNIVAVHRVGRLSNDLPFFVMQYVKGRTMDERLQAEGPLPVSEARNVIVEVASALAAAHQKGIVHRDVRPDNVLYEEESSRALLSDFGIAAILASGEAGQAARLTRTGELVGDPAYMSPERLSGQDLTERSDVYALGILGYELLTGAGPYLAKSRRELIAAHIQAEPKRLSDLRGDVDPDLEAVLRRCLSKEPDYRPNAADVARRLASPGEVTPMPPLRAPAPGGRLSSITERRLPQIVIAYGAVAWIVLQVSWQLVESEVLPRVVYQLALVAIATGFPAVLTGAWFHGKKGRQRFEPVEYWVFGGLALIWLAVSALLLIKWRSG